MRDLNRLSQRLVALSSFAVLALAGACGSELPQFPVIPEETGIECGQDDLMCDDDQQCIDGRCYGTCSADGDCSRREMCVDGVCVPGPIREIDVGPADTGPREPCDGVDCSGAPGTPICHPATEACVQCLLTGCPASAPTCDFARGVCRSFDGAGVCRPCNATIDCGGTDACIELEGERVCLPACSDAAGCPRGLDCNGTRCMPRSGSCTAFYASTVRRPCTMDADCSPLGGTPSPGQCNPVDMTCRQPCTDTADCPPAFGCVELFCTPAP